MSMQKVMFTRTVKVAQADGKGPTYEAGKAYWMRPDSVMYWQSEDAVTDAPADMVAENEPKPGIRAADVRIEASGRARYNVVVHGVTLTDKPVKADEAERLRQRLLSGDAELLAMLQPAPAMQVVQNEPVDEAKSIILRQDRKDDVVTIYVAEPWPAKARIDLDAVEGSEFITVDGNDVMVAVANGSALYRRNGEDFDLVEQSYEAAPEVL